MKTGLAAIRPRTAVWVSWSVNDPEPVLDAEMVGRHQRRAIAQACFDRAQHLAVGVGIEPEDRAEVEPGRVVEGQPVGLGAGERLLVRDRSSPGRTAPAAPAPGSPLRVCVVPSTSKRLLVDVKRGVIFLAEDALPQPVLEEPRGPGVAVLGARCRRAPRGSAPAGSRCAGWPGRAGPASAGSITS